MKNSRIFITGGCGTLGREIIRRCIVKEYNSHITVFSTDPTKHARLKRMFPEVHTVVGDIRDPVTLYNAMAGHNIVIHAAAVKEIPTSEVNPTDAYQVNVEGSINVANAAIQHNIEHVVGISTDKACHPANAYGATKMLMEKVFQEYSLLEFPTQFHLLRYGNVLESTASVIEVWKGQIERGEPIRITNPHMTRFWLSPAMAASMIEEVIDLHSGFILVPQMKSLSIQELIDFTLEGDFKKEFVPLRPGEKLHETLVTTEEIDFARKTLGGFIIVRPTTYVRNDEVDFSEPYTSYNAPRLTQEELAELLKNELPA